jgi:Methyltransferase domain
LWLRAHLPEPMKRLARGARLLFSTSPPGAPAIPQELLEGCRLLSSREKLVEELPRGGRVCEVGSQRGAFAKVILNISAPAELHLIDVDFSPLDPMVRRSTSVVLHQALSHQALTSFADESLDWIYIDADHSYRCVVSDIEMAAPKVKRGGYLAFNDFARIVRPGLGTFGVHQAVCEFVVRERWPLSHFCMNGEALYDVALRKP